MTNQVPATLESVITARIGPIIGEMIPEETLRSTVKLTLDRFLATQLPALVSKELEARFTALLKEELNDPQYREVWTSFGQESGPRTKELIKSLVPDLVAAAMAAPFNMLMSNMRNQLQQSLGRSY